MKKTYLISGAGSGIGQAIAVSLAADGHTLVLLGRNQDKLEGTRSMLVDPSQHHTVVADVRDGPAMRGALSALGLLLDGCVANAGICSDNHYGEGDCWHEMIDVNLTGTYVFVQEALRFFKPSSQGYRHILVVSSLTSRIGLAHYSAYTASKTAQIGLVRVWAKQYARDKVLVNALVPGFVRGAMCERGFEDLARIAQMDLTQMTQKQLQHIPLRKLCEPEEVGAYAAFVLSGKQCSITGQTLDINNGVAMP